MMITPGKKYHFVGIGGVGMSALARVLLEMGCRVSGSDSTDNDYTAALSEKGARVFRGHSARQVEGSEIVVYSTAIRADNPEVLAARKNNIPCVHRSLLLAGLMENRTGIAVTGTHGKTTTASMLSAVMSGAGLAPTVILGGNGGADGANACLGKSSFLVCEADESDGSFSVLTPSLALITNIEDDHLDYYGSFEKLMAVFSGFAGNTLRRGGVVVFSDHPSNTEVLGGLDARRTVCFGFSRHSAVRGADFRDGFQGCAFAVVHGGRPLGEIELRMPGIHNAYNALGAAAAALRLGIGFKAISRALASFRGVKRRFQSMGEAGGVLVVEDYAHHPAELRYAVKAARSSGRRVIAVFQPHRFSRTKILAAGLCEGLFQADAVLVTDIYAAGEENSGAVSSSGIVDALSARGHRNASYVPAKEEIPGILVGLAARGDIVIILGAGDINEITPKVLEAFSNR